MGQWWITRYHFDVALKKKITRWRCDGKFFRELDQPVTLRGVTYGPFPGGWPERFSNDFSLMTEVGINAIRLYEMPTQEMLDEAHNFGLRIFGGLNWQQNTDFLTEPKHLSAAVIQLTTSLREIADHPALAGIFIGNEIASDLVRWMGPYRVRLALEQLIAAGRACAPDLLFAYANYPSTEYLEPENADFTALNLYLENEDALRRYLPRIHHLAGDRPVVISEFGLDSRRNGLQAQAETLRWAAQAIIDHQHVGMFAYAWSDRWWNRSEAVLDWDFGLLDRSGNPKPALSFYQKITPKQFSSQEKISLIICSRNGRLRLPACLDAVKMLDDGNYEVIVVDDGSSDGTADWLRQHATFAKIIELPASGLSAARNAGALAASGEILAFTDDDCRPDRLWLHGLREKFSQGGWHAIGGPNLPPDPESWSQAIVTAAPGAPSHVMLDDVEAEHLPGCNLAVLKSAFLSIGGFDSAFETAGDDVDFCWRLSNAGFRMGFSPAAFVWHDRRPTLIGYLRQQLGYGRAERLLIAKHPQRFSNKGTTLWRGTIYHGDPTRAFADSIIYYGEMGTAGYQSITDRMQPTRSLHANFTNDFSPMVLGLIRWLQPRLRSWARVRRFSWQSSFSKNKRGKNGSIEEMSRPFVNELARLDVLDSLLLRGWRSLGPHDPWDLEKQNTRFLCAIIPGSRAGEGRLLIRMQHANPSMRDEVSGLIDDLTSPPNRG